ncbi:MAG TPA: PorV/PorQ family protein [Ignavibacteriales bacterium]|nr:PorV/PorQ family protein [Ignavibacteriales bacterium]
MLKKMLLPLFLLALLITESHAQLKIGKYAGEFMAIGVGGRANAMGGAYVAVANDVTAGYWNPAALARIDYPQIALMYSQNFGSLVNYNYASAALPYGQDMSFGLSIIRLGVDGIPDNRQALVDNENNVIYDIYRPDAHFDPSRIKEFSDADWAFYFTFAKRQSDKLYYGANVKLIRRSIAEYTATGIGFDVGLLYQPTDKLSLGVNVQDITTTLVAWNTGTNELISPTAKTGIAYAFNFLYGKVTPAAGFDMRFENRRFASQMNVGPVSLDFRGGLEYSYADVVAVRMGYNDIKDFTVGAGVRLPKLNIDYSFAHFSGAKEDALGDSHKISLTLTLESPKFLRGAGK